MGAGGGESGRGGGVRGGSNAGWGARGAALPTTSAAGRRTFGRNGEQSGGWGAQGRGGATPQRQVTEKGSAAAREFFVAIEFESLNCL